MNKYFIHTFGCHESEADAERIAGEYEARGFVSASNWQDADEIILNTCTIRQASEDEVVKYLNQIETYVANQKITKPKIIITGCMVNYGVDEIMKKLPWVDQVLPVSEVGFNTPAIRRNKHHAWVQLSVGCNCFCSFCIIPFSRGREVSRPMSEIIKEVKQLVDDGYTEITLLGMNTNSYGLERKGESLKEKLFDFENQLTIDNLPTNQIQYRKHTALTPFVTLLRQISKFESIKKISFLTANVWDLGDDLIQEIATNPKIDRQIHLPMQSGSNRILKLMNRGYTRNEYLEVLRKLRQKCPEIAITTDMIVGFPTETENEFQESIEAALDIGWVSGNVFCYSPRAGTAAHRLYADDIPDKEKKRRREILDDVINNK